MGKTFTENIRMALDSVWTNKFRSLLTILGIVIGITTVVTVASLLTGLRQGIVTFFDELGPDSIFVKRFSGDPSAGGRPGEQTRPLVRPEYADFLARAAVNIEDVAVSNFLTPRDVGRVLVAKVEGFDTDRVNLVGSTANSFDVAPAELQAGRFFTEGEAARGEKVAVIGHDIGETLFPAGGALGKTFQLDGAEYRIIGIRAKAKGGFFGENGIDQQVNIPFKTFEMRYPSVERYMLTARARPERRADAFEEVEGLVRKIRRLEEGEKNDFDISTPDQIIEQFDKITGLILIASIAISGLGLLVGGIGVMNIMLVSVTERTKEIGVRKAIGATRGDVILQFLTEAITLTGVGGVLGVLFSIAITLLIGLLVPSLPSVVPAWALVTGFTVSLAVGLFFGVWPAVKAARLDPVDALRYE